MRMLNKLLVSLGLAIGSDSLLAAPHCAVTLHSDDQIRWDQPSIEVSKQCKTFTVTLVHEGSLSKEVMGHNWLLTKAEDKEAVIRAVMSAKDSGFIKDDQRIVAHTGLIGGGEQTTVTFEVSKLVAGQKYSYFCSYPEHSELMQGTLTLVD